MPKYRDTPPAEAYELLPPQTSSDPTDSSEPLLPRYERHRPSSPSSPSTSKQPSPHQLHETTKRRRRLVPAIRCVLVSILIIAPTLGLIGCYFGRGFMGKLRGWDRWEDVPDSVKGVLEGLEGMVPRPHGGGGDLGVFPTDIGYAGPTPTGVEAALLATAPSMPMFTAVSPLIAPSPSKSSFNIIQHWGNLSPYYSVDSHGLPESNSLIPQGCEIEGLHWLQRHGARYPTSGDYGPAGIAARLKAAGGWKAKGDLEFLNGWDYKLGAEVLTPFGRGQLFNLGVSARVKYGNLLEKMKGRLPVFRTESQDRMLKSAQNFAAGFFGYPAEEQYNLEVMIESPGFNCTLAPWNACYRNNDTSGTDASIKMSEWDNVYLADAKERLGGMMDGYELTIRDVKDFMDMCAYETVALGYSSFCDLFTIKEFKGYEYRNDIYWWYSAAFGYKWAKPMAMGWVQELVSRLTHTRISEFDSTTNSSFHDDVHFPLNDPIYVDFTHDTQFMLLLPMMNLTSFAETGDLPTDHIPRHRSFIASKICPFATNLQIQVLSCPSKSDKQVRLILNDAPVPLTGINGCEENDEGMCGVGVFVDGMKELIGEVDFVGDCASGDMPGERRGFGF